MQLRAWLEEVIGANEALEARVEALEASAAVAGHEKAALEGWVRGSVQEQAAAASRLASFQVDASSCPLRKRRPVFLLRCVVHAASAIYLLPCWQFQMPCKGLWGRACWNVKAGGVFREPYVWRQVESVAHRCQCVQALSRMLETDGVCKSALIGVLAIHLAQREHQLNRIMRSPATDSLHALQCIEAGEDAKVG